MLFKFLKNSFQNTSVRLEERKIGQCYFRPLRAATPAQGNVSSSILFGFSDDLEYFGDDVDIISLHDDFYGVPWNYFLGISSEPTSAWVEYVKNTQSLIKKSWKDKPVFLSLEMVNGGGGRSCPSKNATTGKDGELEVKDFDGCSSCFNFSGRTDLMEAYIRYVHYMIESFEPEYVNYAIEVNLYRGQCGIELFEHVMDFCNRVYDSISNLEKELVAFPSFQIDFMLGGDPCTISDNTTTCIKKHLEELSIVKRDRFAISSYPHVMSIEFNQPFSPPWLYEVLEEVEEPSVIAETGFLTTPVVVDTSSTPTSRTPSSCKEVFTSNSTMAANYLKFVFDTAVRYDMDFLTWFSEYDALPSGLMTLCPCQPKDKYQKRWCGVEKEFRKIISPPSQGELTFKLFGTMGVRDYEGFEKPELMKIWNWSDV